jgi:large subunit ribosomal protein L17
MRVVQNKKIAHKLFAEIAPRFAGRNGGYTHIFKTRNRPGDAAALAIIELLPPEAQEEKVKAGKKPTKKKAAQKKS